MTAEEDLIEGEERALKESPMKGRRGKMPVDWRVGHPLFGLNLRHLRIALLCGTQLTQGKAAVGARQAPPTDWALGFDYSVPP